MKNFEKFIKEEVDLRGNKGVPTDFMRKSDEEAARNLGIRPDDESQMRNLWPSFEGAMRQSQQILSTGPNGQRLSQQEVQERITKLEKLAEKVIRDQFGEILDSSIKPIELDIKIEADFNTVPEKYHEVFLNIMTAKYNSKVSFGDNPFSKCQPAPKKHWYQFWKK